MSKKVRNIWLLILCCFLSLSGTMTANAQESGKTQDEAKQSAEISQESEQEAEPSEEVTEEKLTIATLEDFLSFAENCRLDSYSENLVVSLEEDIDFGDTTFAGIPIFSGTFEGNEHRIKGLKITENGSVQGLFRYLTATAVVQNLTVEGEIRPQGSRSYVGGIAGSNAGKIIYCNFEGSVAGANNIGGLAGTNTLTGIIDGCHVEGNIYGDHFVGGFAGENYGVIRYSTNLAQINTTVLQNSVEISDITMDTLTNSESVNTVTDIGGIAGMNSGVIRECVNHGDVGYKHMDYNVGGIAGSQSGYIVACENHGKIYGRKEAGGIVGQMEPVTKVEYTMDTLQILQGQLDRLSELTDRTSTNAENSASNVNSQIRVLRNQVETAKEAVDQMLPDVEIPDSDTIQAAQNNLSSSLSAMTGTLSGIAATTKNSASVLSKDIKEISQQIDAMSETIDNASDNLGGSITDVSDADTAEDITGKVENCINYGDVMADLNVGGIAGAIAYENDLDPEEDITIIGESSLNFDSEIRAVILNCKNYASVTVKRQNVGGITGWQSMGLIKSSLNAGTVNGATADYVGGICGQSTGFIRSCSTKCELSGDAYVGGIAGSATIVSDCRSMVYLLTGTEKLGAILGLAEESLTEAEAPIQNNLYMTVYKDIGGIDGISYSGCAQPLAMQEFLELDNLPEMFQSVTVTFCYEDGSEHTVAVTPGGKLHEKDIPVVPKKEGYVGEWAGLAETDLTDIAFDMTFHTVYTGHGITIQSKTTGENNRPIMLIQGTFTKDATVTLSESEKLPVLLENQTIIETWCFTISENEKVTRGRYLIPQDYDPEELYIFMGSENGDWKEVPYSIDGSYMVFELSGEENQIAIVHMNKVIPPWLIGGIGIIMSILVILFFVIWIRRRTRRKKNEKNLDS